MKVKGKLQLSETAAERRKNVTTAFSRGYILSPLRGYMLLAVFAFGTAFVFAQQETPQPQTQEAQPKKDDDGKLISVPGGKALGMSILGNQEAPKALVIVPWKRSELGNVLGISPLLDDSKLPIDKEVFMRMLSYYDVKSGTAQPTAAAQRRK